MSDGLQKPPSQWVSFQSELGGHRNPPRRDTCLIQAGHQGVCIPRSLQEVALPSAEDGVSHRP